MYLVSIAGTSELTKPRILAVIVLYKMSFDQSETVQTLLEARKIAGDRLQCGIVIFDNTPGGQDPGTLPECISYVAAPENPGLAAAYNAALITAASEGFDWLLTLDQDTRLPPAFLSAMSVYTQQYDSVERVAAIVPRIADHGRLISPFRFVAGFLPRILPPAAKGISKRFTSALNSASLLRVTALQELGGYDFRFPMHNSDTSLYHRLSQAGKQVVVASDIHVNHELAILQRQDRMTPTRYRCMLVDECTFWDLNMGFLGRLERITRLMGRICKGYFQGENTTFRNVTLEEIKRRLLTRRTARIRDSEKAFFGR